MKVKVRKRSIANRLEKLHLNNAVINYVTGSEVVLNSQQELARTVRLYEWHDGVEKISESDFIKIVDAIHYHAHNPIVRNCKARVFANLTILEYANLFNVKLRNQNT